MRECQFVVDRRRYEKLPKGFLQRTLEREAASSAITKARLKEEEDIWWRNATKKEIDEREQEEAKVLGNCSLLSPVCDCVRPARARHRSGCAKRQGKSRTTGVMD